METNVKNWIKTNCQKQPTSTKIEFYETAKDKTTTVYLKDTFKGYLTDDLDDFGDFEWVALGNDLLLADDNLEIVIYDTPITTQVLF